MNKFLLSLALCLLSTAAFSAGTTANVSWEWPTASAVTDPVTGVIKDGPPNYVPADFQDAVITWFVTGTQTVAGMKTVIAPTKATSVPVICGDYDFVVFVRLKSGTPLTYLEATRPLRL